MGSTCSLFLELVAFYTNHSIKWGILNYFLGWGSEVSYFNGYCSYASMGHLCSFRCWTIIPKSSNQQNQLEGILQTEDQCYAEGHRFLIHPQIVDSRKHWQIIALSIIRHIMVPFYSICKFHRRQLTWVCSDHYDCPILHFSINTQTTSHSLSSFHLI